MYNVVMIILIMYNDITMNWGDVFRWVGKFPIC